MEEWVKFAKETTDDDGTGYYSDGKRESSKEAHPSDVEDGTVDMSFSHVVWYNR